MRGVVISVITRILIVSLIVVGQGQPIAVVVLVVLLVVAALVLRVLLDSVVLNMDSM